MQHSIQTQADAPTMFAVRRAAAWKPEAELLRAAREPSSTQVAATKKCGKCDGKGGLAIYAHINGGVCFSCQGKGVRARTSHTTAAYKEQVAEVAKAAACEAINSALRRVQALAGLSAGKGSERCKKALAQLTSDLARCS